MKKKKFYFLCFLFTFLLSVAMLQSSSIARIAPATAGNSLDKNQFYLSLAVLVFGLIVLGLEVAILWKSGRGWGPTTVQICGLTLVIVAGVFLITAGYSQDQIAPMIGLLGTIAGYLLGRSEDKGSSGG